MSQQQTQIRRESAQFREDPELRRRRPIGKEGPLPVPLGPVPQLQQMTFFGGAMNYVAALDDESFTFWFATGLGASPRSRVPVDRPGSLGNIRVNVATNTLDGSTVIDVLVNGVSVGLTFTYTAGETGLKSLDGSAIVLAAGDRVSVNGDGSASTVGAMEGGGSVEFIPLG